MKELRGYSMILAAALFWGASATAAKMLLNRQVDTLLIVQTRVTVSFCVYLVVFAVLRREVFRVSLRDLWRFALLGVVGVAGSNFTYYFTMRESTVATAILIQYTAPLLVMAYARLAKEEPVTPVKIVAAVVSLSGCFLAVGAYDVRVLRISGAGLVSGAASIVCFAFLTVYPRHILARYSVWTMTLYAMLSASLFWLLVNPPWAIARAAPPADDWWPLAGLAVCSVLIPHTLFFSGLRHIVPSRAIIVSTLEPVTAILSAALILGESLEPLQVFGAVLVIAAIVLLETRREAPPERVSREATHGGA
jgi:drug/metabolite transporter (DMT)-like permease